MALQLQLTTGKVAVVGTEYLVTCRVSSKVDAQVGCRVEYALTLPPMNQGAIRYERGPEIGPLTLKAGVQLEVRAPAPLAALKVRLVFTAGGVDIAGRAVNTPTLRPTA